MAPVLALAYFEDKKIGFASVLAIKLLGMVKKDLFSFSSPVVVQLSVAFVAKNFLLFTF